MFIEVNHFINIGHSEYKLLNTDYIQSIEPCTAAPVKSTITLNYGNSSYPLHVLEDYSAIKFLLKMGDTDA